MATSKASHRDKAAHPEKVFYVDVNKPPKCEMVVTVSVKVSRWVNIRYKIAVQLMRVAAWLMNSDIEFVKEIVDE